MITMEKYFLAAFAIWLMVEICNSQESPPTLYAVQNASTLCPSYTGDTGAVGATSTNNPCELKCLTKGSTKTIRKKDGEECSTDATPNICYNNKCVEQVASTEATDKGYLCTAYGNYKAIAKGVCTVMCIPPTTSTAKAVELPAMKDSFCLKGTTPSSCSGTTCT